jgi:DNA repair exonuclease SbcCD nuclease subunit
MMPLLHIGDVHLGAPYTSFGDVAGERRRAVLEAFRSLPDVAARLGAQAVLLTGDLFHSPRPDDDVSAAARETLRRLVEGGRPVLAVPGNHDRRVADGWPYEEMPAGVTVFGDPSFGEPVSLELAGGALHVYGLAYDAAQDPQPLASFRRAPLDGVHVLLLHAGIRDAPQWSAGRALRASPEELAGLDADYIALGDYHRFRAPAEFDPGGGIPACYCGSFAAVDATEDGPRGFVRVELEGGRPPAVEHLSSGVPEVLAVGSIDISDCAGDLEVARRIVARAGLEAESEGELNPYVTAILEGQPPFPVDPERVTTELCARFGFVRVQDRSRYFDSAAVRELAARPSISGHVARLGVERVESASSADDARLHERALRLALRALETRT